MEKLQQILPLSMRLESSYIPLTMVAYDKYYFQPKITNSRSNFKTAQLYLISRTSEEIGLFQYHCRVVLIFADIPIVCSLPIVMKEIVNLPIFKIVQISYKEGYFYSKQF